MGVPVLTYDAACAPPAGEPPAAFEVAVEGLTEQPLVLEYTVVLAAPCGEVFAYIADFAAISEWMPMITKSWSDDTHAEEPGGVGAVRMISAWGGKVTDEVVRHRAEGLLCYSASDAALGGMLSAHLGVQACTPCGDGQTRLVWRCYGRPPDGAFMRWFGRNVISKVMARSLHNLARRWPSSTP